MASFIWRKKWMQKGIEKSATALSCLSNKPAGHLAPAERFPHYLPHNAAGPAVPGVTSLLHSHPRVSVIDLFFVVTAISRRSNQSTDQFRRDEFLYNVQSKINSIPLCDEYLDAKGMKMGSREWFTMRTSYEGWGLSHGNYFFPSYNKIPEHPDLTYFLMDKISTIEY